MDDQIQQSLSRIEAQNEAIGEQYSDLALDIKELTAQFHQFHITTNSQGHQISNLVTSHQEVLAKLDVGSAAMRGLQQSVSDAQHGQANIMLRIESLNSSGEASRGEIGKIWEYVHGLNVTVTTTNTRISTSTALISAVGGVLLSVMMAMVGYFGILVIEDSKKIAVIEVERNK